MMRIFNKPLASIPLSLLIALITLVPTQTVFAGAITVNGGCSLINAIITANTDTDTGGCTGAAGADTITLDANVNLVSAYGSSTNIGGGQAGLPDITSDITIVAGAGTTISGNDSDFRIVYVHAAGTLTLDGVTLQNGRIQPADNSALEAHGGSIYLDGATLNMINGATLTANQANGSDESTVDSFAAYGGGIYATNSTVTISDNSSLSSNQANGDDSPDRHVGGNAYGGGIYLDSASTLSLRNSRLSSNQANGGFSDARPGSSGNGGGIYNNGTIITFTDNTLSSNIAEGSRAFFWLVSGAGNGGGIYNSGTITTLSNNTLSGNQANGGSDGSDSGGTGNGGGIYNNSTITTLSSNTLSGNQANGGNSDNRGASNNGGTGNGGGVYNSGTITTLSNNTLSSNQANGGNGRSDRNYDGGNANGGGIFNSNNITTFSSNTLSGNQANGGDGGSLSPATGGNGRGGGVYNIPSPPPLSNTVSISLYNSTLSGNSVSRGTAVTNGVGEGGAIYSSRDMSLIHLTLLSNTADDTSDAIYSGATITLTASIIASPSGVVDCSGIIADGGNNRGADDGDTSCTSLGSITIGTDIDSTLTNNGGITDTHALLTGSSLINATVATCASVSNVDQRNTVRDTNCDIGAYEYDGIFPSVGFSVSPLTVYEVGLPNTAIVTVTATNLLAGSLSPDFIFSGTATEGVDYVISGLSASNEITLTPTNSTQSFTITIINDAITEGTETFDITMAIVGSYPITGTNPQTVTIEDGTASYAGTVTLIAFDNIANETAGDDGQYVVDLGAINTFNSPIIVYYSVAGTATAGLDYNTLSGSVEIPAGSQSVTFDLVPFDDKVDDDNETVIVTLSSTNTSGIGVDASPATVTITDNDTAGILINPTGVSSIEGGSTDYLVQLLTQPEPGETVTVTITDNTGGEVASVTASVILTEANWNIGETVSITLNDDALANGNRTIAAAFTHTASSDVGASPYNSLGAITSVTLDVIDNETANIIVDPTAFSLIVNQDGTYDVYLSQEPGSDVTVTLTPLDANCTYSTNTLTFTDSGGANPWNVAQTVTVTGGATDNVFCIVEHSATGGAYAGVTGKNATVYLLAIPTTPTRPTTGTTIIISSNDGQNEHLGDFDYMQKTVDNPFATGGDTVTYTIIAHNPKNIPLTQVVIYDVFDERLNTIQLLSTTHGFGSLIGRTLIVEGFTLQPDESATIIVSARVRNDFRAGDVIPNIAALESPDASVHVSNLALIGDTVAGSNGEMALLPLFPNELPSTGESSFLKQWTRYTALLLVLLSIGAGIFLRRRIL